MAGNALGELIKALNTLAVLATICPWWWLSACPMRQVNPDMRKKTAQRSYKYGCLLKDLKQQTWCAGCRQIKMGFTSHQKLAPFSSSQARYGVLPIGVKGATGWNANVLHVSLPYIIYASKGLKLFFSRYSKSAFSRHDNVRASSTLFIWLNENVRIIAPIMFSLIAHAGACPLSLSPKSPVLRFVKSNKYILQIIFLGRTILEENNR